MKAIAKKVNGWRVFRARPYGWLTWHDPYVETVVVLNVPSSEFYAMPKGEIEIVLDKLGTLSYHTTDGSVSGQAGSAESENILVNMPEARGLPFEELD